MTKQSIPKASSERAQASVPHRYEAFLSYDELTQVLRALADENPEYTRLSSIGESHEGREIHCLAITDLATGAPEDKPGIWIDGNIHATELAASSAVLHFAEVLLSQRAVPKMASVLASSTYYLVPRLNPDGAELAIAPSPRFVRSSTRTYPSEPPTSDGFVVKDIDGDGVIRQMRVLDENGPWKASTKDPRVLIRRSPEDLEGPFYRVFPEGSIRNYDGTTIDRKPETMALDLNRNFPAQWRPEHEQVGAGPFPASEPEVATVTRFFDAHPNIAQAVTFHTYGGLLLRPFSHLPDEKFPTDDLRTYKHIGEVGERLTGYPAVSVFHDFRYDPHDVITGAFDDWAYEHHGVFAWTVEIWSPKKAAEIDSRRYIEWYIDHPEEDDHKFMKWNDEVLNGAGFQTWTPFEHPQLGPVELGGWDTLRTFRNPPLHLLQEEVEKFSDWLIYLGLSNPKLAVTTFKAEVVGEAIKTNDQGPKAQFLLTAVIENQGFLGTSITKRTQDKGISKGVRLQLEGENGFKVISGKADQRIGHLSGIFDKSGAVNTWTTDTTTEKSRQTWLVRGTKGQTVTLTASAPKCGRVIARVTL